MSQMPLHLPPARSHSKSSTAGAGSPEYDSSSMTGSSSVGLISRAPNNGESGSQKPATPENLEQKFEEEFSQHLQKQRNRVQRFQLGAVGAGIGGCIGVAASPMLVPGLCVAALVGGAGGYQWAKRWGKQELAKQRGAPSADTVDAGLQNNFRRLKFLVKWGHFQLLEYEDSPPEWQSAVLDEVVRAFSPWVQKMYLLRARGCAGEADTEAWEVFVHLAPLYYLLQRRPTVEAIMHYVESVEVAIHSGTVDAACAERLNVSFPTILETISTIDRLSPATHATLQKETSASKPRGVHSKNRANRRHRLQRIVDVIRKVLERPGVREALDEHQLREKQRSALPQEEVELEAPDSPKPAPVSPASSSTSKGQMQLVVPPEGVENEHGGGGGSDEDQQYFSVSESEDDEAASSSSARKRCHRSPRKGGSAASTDGSGVSYANFSTRLKAFPCGEGSHNWTHFDASEFNVRSETYLLDKRKEPSESSMFELVNVDFQLVGPSGPVWSTAQHKDFFAAQHRARGDRRFLLIQNWVFPPFQCVLTGALDPQAPWLRGGTLRSPQARLWEKFLEMDDKGKSDVFKVICSVEDGPWLAKHALPKKPVLIGRQLKMSTHHQPGEYLEIVLDVASTSRSQQVAVGIVCGALKRIQLAFSALIEAREEEELPENIMLSATMMYMDPAKLFSPEVT